MLPGMAGKPEITIVGPGNLGAALAAALVRSGYAIDGIVSTQRRQSLQRAAKLAGEIGARVLSGLADVKSRVIWLCVPDSEIASAASKLSRNFRGKGRIALHSSGALTSDALAAFRKTGAAVASVHPLMTFVRGSSPSLAGVSFAIEGDPAAVRLARKIVLDFRGKPYSIRKENKPAYHAWSTFICPLFMSLLATGEHVAHMAGVNHSEARRRAIPIMQQTLANYAAFGAPGAFSGPVIRGDTDTVRKHLRVLRATPPAREVYSALVHAALLYLPSKSKKDLKRLLDSSR